MRTTCRYNADGTHDVGYLSAQQRASATDSAQRAADEHSQTHCSRHAHGSTGARVLCSSEATTCRQSRERVDVSAARASAQRRRRQTTRAAERARISRVSSSVALFSRSRASGPNRCSTRAVVRVARLLRAVTYCVTKRNFRGLLRSVTSGRRGPARPRTSIRLPAAV
jgi:hypothetical protein